MFVPVVNQFQEPLMPTIPSRAKKWIKSGKATGFFKKGVFCVRLNKEPSDNKKQEIVVGIDPGSKREGYTVKSTAHTYLNILSDTVDWVKDSVERRRNARRTRRNRKTPYRKNRLNRVRGGLPPSTKARWQLKLRVSRWLVKMFPITTFIVEDIKAITKGYCKWNKIFSPLQIGKQWFYEQLKQLGILKLMYGYETKELRDSLGFKKITNKLAEKFEAHNVDSWVLAYSIVGGVLDNRKIIRLFPIQLHRRQLHVFQSAKNSIRKKYGGTRSLGFSRGSIVKHNKFGITYIGGNSKNRISLHSIENSDRLTRNVKAEDIKFLTYNSWRIFNVC